MAKKLLGLVGVVALAIAAVMAVPALATGPTHKNVHFTSTLVGASFSSNKAAFTIHDSVAGNGAGVQTITSVSAKGGTDTATVYYGDATAVSRDTFSLSAPDAKGIIKITGHGHNIRGTGKLKHLSSHYTFSGTFDPKTTIIHASLSGVESY